MEFEGGTGPATMGLHTLKKPDPVSGFKGDTGEESHDAWFVFELSVTVRSVIEGKPGFDANIGGAGFGPETEMRCGADVHFQLHGVVVRNQTESAGVDVLEDQGIVIEERLA